MILKMFLHIYFWIINKNTIALILHTHFPPPPLNWYLPSGDSVPSHLWEEYMSFCLLGMSLWFALATDTSDNAPVLTLGLNRHYIFLLLLLNLCRLVGGDNVLCWPPGPGRSGEEENEKCWSEAGSLLKPEESGPPNLQTHEQNKFSWLYVTKSLRLFIMPQKWTHARNNRDE